jgi:metal-responsive CopG/Arc/MetJ family transcriptional regulator
MAARMPRPKPKEPVQQVCVLIPEDWVKRLDIVAEHLADGTPPSRSAALRMAIRRGLEALEATGQKRR